MRHTLVVGGGIAGLSVAWQLARDSARRVTLLEREAFCGTHSSARNAQIWLPIDELRTTGALALRSAAMLEMLLGSERAWLRRGHAIVLVPDAASADAMLRSAGEGGLSGRSIGAAELAERCPAVRSDEMPLRIDGAGILDPHAMLGALERACKSAGVAIRNGAGVRRVLVRGRVRGVELDDASELAADEVVIAAGAWSGAIGESAGVAVPLVPLRRHLVLLDADPRRAGTTVWRFGPRQVYFRPESGGVLASPCDETPFEACLPPSDPAALELLAEELAPVAPELVEAPVRTKWACLRTYAHDRELVLGPDPRVEGLAWLTGFGGRGMTIGVAAGQLCAAAMRGERDPLLSAMRPDRNYPERLVDA
jgi:D-arginine dehydrogenase